MIFNTLFYLIVNINLRDGEVLIEQLWLYREVKRCAWCRKTIKWFSWNLNSSHLTLGPMFNNTIILCFCLDITSCFKTMLCFFFTNYLMIFSRIFKYYIKITCPPLLNLWAGKIYLISFLTYQLHFVIFYSCHQKRMKWNLRSKLFHLVKSLIFLHECVLKSFFFLHAYIYFIILDQDRFPPNCSVYLVPCSFEY